MAIQIPIITSLEDSGIKAAKAAFNNFKSAVGEAEGGMNKFKAGAGAALQAVKANAGTFALAAGSAVVTFAAKGVGAFQDLAIASGKFADATGLSVEEASRLLEVTGDLGIEAGSVETAIGKMNQNLGKSPELFRELGVQVAYAKDGTVDANETFLNTIDRLNKIKDPAERARVASQLLGKGWRDMSEIIAGGSDKLRSSLKGVADAKVISKTELENARKFRSAMDDLKDSSEELALELGATLVPTLTTIVDLMNKIKPLMELNPFRKADLEGVSDRLKSMVQDVPTAMREAREETDRFKQSIQEFRLNKITGSLGPINTAFHQTAIEIGNIDEAWDMLVANFDEQVAFDQAVEKLAEVEEAAAQAFATGADSDIAKYNVAAADMVGLLAIISEGLGSIASRNIKIRFEAEGPAAALALAQYYRGGAEFMGLSPTQALTQAGIPTLSAGSSSGAGTIGGSTINVTVTSADPNQVVAAIQQWTRNNGALPLTTTTDVRR